MRRAALSPTIGIALYCFLGFSLIHSQVAENSQPSLMLTLNPTVVKVLRLMGAYFVAALAGIVMVRNELQVRKLSPDVTRELGQVIYEPLCDIPLSSPYCGACVLHMDSISLSLSGHLELRKGLDSTLYLIENYHFVQSQTVLTRVYDTKGDMSSKKGPGNSWR
jgi:hypothetical protein